VISKVKEVEEDHWRTSYRNNRT